MVLQYKMILKTRVLPKTIKRFPVLGSPPAIKDMQAFEIPKRKGRSCTIRRRNLTSIASQSKEWKVFQEPIKSLQRNTLNCRLIAGFAIQFGEVNKEIIVQRIKMNM